MTAHARPVSSAALSLVALFVLVGCGARTGLVDDDHLDADVDNHVDADSDGTPPPGTCTVPAQPRSILNETAPGSVYTLARLAQPNRYVLGCAMGWAHDRDARLVVLDDQPSVISTLSEGADSLYIGRSADPEVLVAAHEVDNEVQLLTYSIRLESPPFFERVYARPLCPRHCMPARQPLLAGPEGFIAAVALNFFSEDVVGVTLVPDHPDSPLVEGQRVPAISPKLVYTSEGELILFVTTSLHQVEGYRLNGDGEVVEQLSWSGEMSYHGSFLAAASVDLDGSFLIVYPGLGGMELARLSAAGNLVDVVVLDEASGMPDGIGLSVSGSTAAISWGESFGAGRVGAHLVVVSLDDLSPMWGPGLLSPPTVRASSTYVIWTATTPHRRGHLVVWNAWHETTNYGIYGTLVTCSE